MPPPALSQRPLFPATSAAALLTLAGPAIVYAHTFLAMLAFIGALGIVALGGYWKEVCTNAVAGGSTGHTRGMSRGPTAQEDGGRRLATDCYLASWRSGCDRRGCAFAHLLTMR